LQNHNSLQQLALQIFATLLRTWQSSATSPSNLSALKKNWASREVSVNKGQQNSFSPIKVMAVCLLSNMPLK